MSVENKRRLCVPINVKPYCYRYLCNNFGIDGMDEGYISLRRSSLLGMVFRSLLHHKTRLTTPIPNNHARWCSKVVYVNVWAHDLTHHGLDLTDHGKKEFAMLVEKIVQEDFKGFFIHMYMVLPHKNLIISRYQQLRGYTENDWPQESMEKMITRMHIIPALKRSREDFLQQYDTFFTANLSALVDYRATKRILSQLCNSTSTTEEASQDCMLSLQQMS